MRAIGPDTGKETDPMRDFADAELAEVPLLLARSQLAALEQAAHDQGLTIGEIARFIIRDYLQWYFLNGLGDDRGSPIPGVPLAERGKG